MKFLIRDDDTCAFTKPEELERCYNDIWDWVPVNLSVTPFRIPGRSSTVPKTFFGQNRPIALEENQELVDFLIEKKQEGKIDIALHGFHHTKPYGMPEYVGGKNLFEKTKKGKTYLEGLLGCKINTFVPPNNGIAREGFDAVVSNRLNLVNIPPLLRPRYRPVNAAALFKYIKIKYFSIVNKMPYPYVLDFKDHQEVGYYSVTPGQGMEVLLDGLEKSKKYNGIFIFAVHYHAFNRRLKTGQRISDVLEHVLDLMKDAERASFITYGELFQNK